MTRPTRFGVVPLIMGLALAALPVLSAQVRGCLPLCDATGRQYGISAKANLMGFQTPTGGWWSRGSAPKGSQPMVLLLRSKRQDWPGEPTLGSTQRLREGIYYVRS